MATFTKDPNLFIYTDQVSGADNRLSIDDADSTGLRKHRVYAYRFVDKDVSKFGKSESTMIISISNDLDKIGEMANLLKQDSQQNCYFEVNIYEDTNTQYQSNNRVKTYGIDVINKSTFVATTSEFFMTHTTEKTDNGLLKLNDSYVWCFTLDIPYDEKLYFANLQSVFFLEDLTSNLSPDEAYELASIKNDPNRVDEIPLESENNITMTFINAYDFAASFQSFKVGFTTIDFNSFDLSARQTPNLSDFPNPTTITNLEHQKVYLTFIRQCVSAMLFPSSIIPKRAPTDVVDDLDTPFPTNGYEFSLLFAPLNNSAIVNTTYNLDAFFEWMYTLFTKDNIDPSDTWMPFALIKKWGDTLPTIVGTGATENVDYRENGSVQMSFFIDGNCFSDLLMSSIPKSTLVDTITTGDLSIFLDPNFIKGVWTDKRLDGANLLGYFKTFKSGSLLPATPTPEQKLAYSGWFPNPNKTLVSNPFPYSIQPMSFATNSDAVVNMITVDAIRQDGYTTIDQLETKVTNQNVIPFKAYPLELLDQPIQKFDWLDWYTNLPLWFLNNFRGDTSATPLSGDGVFVHPSLMQFFYKFAPKDGTNGPKYVELYPGQSTIVMGAIADMICLTTLINNGFKNVDLIKEPTSLYYGKLDPTLVIGYGKYNIGMLNTGGTTKHDLVDKIYNDAIIATNMQPGDEIWMRFHTVICLLSKYINCSAAVAGGGNTFNRAWNSFYIELTSPIMLTRYDANTQAGTPAGIFYDVFTVNGSSTATPPTIPATIDYPSASAEGNLYDLIVSAQFSLNSSYYDVIYSGSTANKNYGFTVSPNITTPSVRIDRPNFSNVGGKIMFPLIPDTITPLDKSIQPGNVDTSSNRDLAHLMWVDLQGSQGAFENLLLKDPGDIPNPPTYAQKITLPTIAFGRVNPNTNILETVGKYPQSDAELRAYITKIVKQFYNVQNDAQITIDSTGTLEIVSMGATSAVDIKSREDDHFAEFYPMGTSGTRRWSYPIGEKLVSTALVSGEKMLDNASRFINPRPTTSLVPVSVKDTDGTTDLHITRLEDVIAYWAILADKKGDEYYHLDYNSATDFSERQLYASMYFNYDWSDTPNERMVSIVPSILPTFGDKQNPKVYFEGFYSDDIYNTRMQGETLMRVIPNQTFIVGATVTLTGHFTSRIITNVISEMNKVEWLNFYTQELGLPIVDTNYQIQATNTVLPYGGGSTINITQLDRIYLRANNLRYCKLTFMDPLTFETQVINLPIPNDIDESVSIHRYVFL